MELSPIRLESLGIVNALGSSISEVGAALGDPSRTGLAPCENLYPGRTVWVGYAKAELPTIPQALEKFSSRNNTLLLAAYQQIEKEVTAARSQFGAQRLGVVLGTSTSGIEVGERGISDRIRTGEHQSYYKLSKQELGSASQFISQIADARGPSYSVSTACSSSAKVFACARNLIRSGLCDAVIVGGADSLCKLTVQGFSALELYSEDKCKPYSKTRNGINIGEGAALFLLTKVSGGVQLLGVGESSDAYHMSTPHPEGIGGKLAISDALDEANISADELSYINLHGTGTQLNDQMEANLMHGLIEDKVPCSSTKGFTGHTLGAAGATEIGFCWLALNGMIGEERDENSLHLPTHVFDDEYDDALPRLQLANKGSHTAAKGMVSMLSNSFAFGGSNCSVIIGKEFG